MITPRKWQMYVSCTNTRICRPANNRYSNYEHRQPNSEFQQWQLCNNFNIYRRSFDLRRDPCIDLFYEISSSISNYLKLSLYLSNQNPSKELISFWVPPNLLRYRSFLVD